MRILDKMRRQKCVYWPPAGKDDYGKSVMGPPEELRVRWEDGGELVLSYDGQEFVPMHTVYVGKDVKELGLMKYITLEELQSPTPPKDAMEIRKFDKVPILKAVQNPKSNQALRIAYL